MACTQSVITHHKIMLYGSQLCDMNSSPFFPGYIPVFEIMRRMQVARPDVVFKRAARKYRRNTGNVINVKGIRKKYSKTPEPLLTAEDVLNIMAGVDPITRKNFVSMGGLSLARSMGTKGEVIQTWISENNDHVSLVRNNKKVYIEERIKNELITKENMANYQTEYKVKSGRIDLVTETELIEIKELDQWTRALGQILSYKHYLADKKARLHLFYEDASWESKKSMIEEVCCSYGVRVTYHDEISPDLVMTEVLDLRI